MERDKSCENSVKKTSMSVSNGIYTLFLSRAHARYAV